MAVAASQNQIPGLYSQPTLADLKAAADTYDSFVRSEDLNAEISPEHLQNLANLFVKYDVHDRLGVQLIHSHAKLAPGRVMLGHTLAEPSGCWKEPVAIDEIDLAAVHGQAFKLTTGDRFVAYEYAEGKASDFSNVSQEFIKELADYLRTNKLEEIAGLQALRQGLGNTVELELGEGGTVLLSDRDTTLGEPSRTTAWVFTVTDGLVSFKGRERHVSAVQGGFTVALNGSLPDIPALKNTLKELGVIN